MSARSINPTHYTPRRIRDLQACETDEFVEEISDFINIYPLTLSILLPPALGRHRRHDLRMRSGVRVTVDTTRARV